MCRLLLTGWRAMQGLDLVVRALGVLLTQQVGANREVATCRLALAGGYDARLEENREVLAQLRELVFTLGLSEQARRRKRPFLFPFLLWYSVRATQESALRAPCMAHALGCTC